MLRFGSKTNFFFLESVVSKPGGIYKTKDSQVSVTILTYFLFACLSLYHILNAHEAKDVMS